MYSIRKQFINFVKISNYCLQLSLNTPFTHNREVYIYSTGILNTIWQSWNRYWRILWLTNLIGGIDINKKKLCPLKPSFNEEMAISYILKILGRNTPSIIRTRHEPTWGDIDKIKGIAMQISNPGNNILNAFSVLGNAPKHLQIVRNASVHLDKDNLGNVKSIVSYYRISKVKYPTDIIYVHELTTGKIAIKSWVDDLIAFLQLI